MSHDQVQIALQRRRLLKRRSAGRVGGDAGKVFDLRAGTGRSTNHAAYDVAPDGRRFLVQLLDPRAIPTQIHVVLNWFEELRANVSLR